MIIEKVYSEITIGEVVANDFRAAELFKNVGIDFCCGGNKSIETACKEKSIDSTLLLAQLKELENIPISQALRFNDWKLDFLADYIVNTHHQYVVKSLPELVYYTQKIARVHGDSHPELLEVAVLFEKINAELLQHLQMEEEVLFPAIKEALKSNSAESKVIIANEINRMAIEHEFAGGAMDRINEITANYKIPDDACNTYNVAFRFLQQFEDDLHIHVHLENNILYAKALTL